MDVEDNVFGDPSAMVTKTRIGKERGIFRFESSFSVSRNLNVQKESFSCFSCGPSEVSES